MYVAAGCGYGGESDEKLIWKDTKKKQIQLMKGVGR